MTVKPKPDEFKHTRFSMWASKVAVFIICLLALYKNLPEAGNILILGIIAIAGHSIAQSGIANKWGKK